MIKKLNEELDSLLFTPLSTPDLFSSDDPLDHLLVLAVGDSKTTPVIQLLSANENDDVCGICDEPTASCGVSEIIELFCFGIPLQLPFNNKRKLIIWVEPRNTTNSFSSK